MANFRTGSRYTNGTFTLDKNNKEFLILRNNISVPTSENDTFFTVEGQYVKRIDLISQEMYGRPDLGWAILDVNNLREPLFDLQVGQVLRIPPLNKILEAIDQANLPG
jgi:hypothetical protein